MTRRRWIADTWDEATASLTGEQASHLIRVLRAQAGMEFDIVAGDRVWHGIIAGITGDQVRFNLVAEVESDPALPVTLLLSVFKFDRMEWTIEKATELGVERIVPVIARRTEKHLGQSAAGRVERWRKIAHQAAQQSRRSDVPVIEDPLPLKTAAKREGEAVKLLLAEQERTTTLRRALVESLCLEEGMTGCDELLPVRLAVGPEGGWTAEEEALFDSEGWKAVSLGPRILRAETAAITALAVVAAMLE
ncbi:16S rRNA (uracil(1498)-N(3))-methyltransferase [Silvibacterium dinghuense]|uniref:Ribosomal RNA small subunit methyltransferase E n=1 Tax=Silvibacterium dinghuense TaxID=1560006 RepID=A0A4Q1SC33_9BACT|nr:16S rRNA (uracil(1498)-N(3))-methyltransferase [Silvibacterium dinghuense]RXS94567.1 16S rRNA (uracil(1498)-N(3))-methyltransferase [Silvibacterium dinghuense]GGH15305.1 ribosomal RNA small subunit methyltransferase E [Silvibacterium dinghuense]